MCVAATFVDAIWSKDRESFEADVKKFDEEGNDEGEFLFEIR